MHKREEVAMKKKISVSLVVTIVLLAMTVTFSVTMMAAMKIFDHTVADVNQKSLMYDKLAEIDNLVRSNYYTDINDQNLLDMMSTGYIAGLGDKNSKYYTAKQVTELNDRYNGKLLGIGVEVVKDSSGYFRVVKVYAGSPAEAAGLTKDVMLTKLDDTELKSLTTDAVNTLLQGEAGTNLRVTYLQTDSTEATVELQRKSYDSPTVEYQLVNGIGYIKIRTFAKATAADMDYAMNRLTEQGASALVFDVRDNTGGKLEYAAECIDLLCPAGTLVSGVYKNGETKVLYTSDANEASLPLVVVTNGNTAFGAELFAVSVHDFGKGKIVGARTAGKGTLQSLLSLKDGSAISLTVAKLVPGKSDSYNGTGVAPDYERVLSAEEELGYYDYTVDTDPQLLRAFEVATSLAKSGMDVVIGEPDPNQTDSDPADTAVGEVQADAQSAASTPAA